MKATSPRFIYVTGADGTGKSTQVRLLIDRLRRRGLRCRHLWLRFPFLLSLPMLAYARWMGYSWYEERGGVRHGYWGFEHSWLMRVVFPWIVLLDATLAALGRVGLPMSRRETIVCERYVLDMLVDLAVALDDRSFWCRAPGSLFLRLLPRDSRIVVLDLDADTARQRRRDLAFDQHLEMRLEAYRHLTDSLSLVRVSSKCPVSEVAARIEAVTDP